jgi:hypothetical protein
LPLSSLTALGTALDGQEAPLSNVAIAGFVPEERNRLAHVLAQHGASRITSPGGLQTPPVDWPRDGLLLFTPLARFIQREG